ncbi:MAG: site-specific tyrosine recombinase/integron integrase [Candidatus Kariarchaeaceae archaeon]|jgi:site-specific recombinase XerD
MIKRDMTIDFFLDYLTIERGCSGNTIKGYSHDLYTLMEYIIEHEMVRDDGPNFKWEEVSLIHLRSYLSHLYNSRNNKTSSIHRRVCSVKAFFKYCKSNKTIDVDPAEELKYPKRPSSIPKFLEQDAIMAILVESNNLLHKAIIEVLYSTGARCNEVRSINLEDINFIERTITIRGGKGGKDRMVLLTKRASSILEEYIEIMRPRLLDKASQKKNLSDDSFKAVFLSNRGTRIANRTIQHFISKLSEKAGVKHTTPHMLRHSFASHMIMNKANIRAVQQLLGHASLDTTQIYANITPDYLKSEFDNSLPIR